MVLQHKGRQLIFPANWTAATAWLSCFSRFALKQGFLQNRTVNIGELTQNWVIEQILVNVNEEAPAMTEQMNEPVTEKTAAQMSKMTKV